MVTDKLKMIDDMELKLSKYETVWLYHALLNMNSADIAMAVPTYPARIAAGIARDLRERLSLYMKGNIVDTEYEIVDEPDDKPQADNIFGILPDLAAIKCIESKFLPRGYAMIGTGDPNEIGFSTIKLGGRMPIDPNHGRDSLCVTSDTLPDKTNGDK